MFWVFLCHYETPCGFTGNTLQLKTGWKFKPYLEIEFCKIILREDSLPNKPVEQGILEAFM